jgi:hypothetical protein
MVPDVILGSPGLPHHRVERWRILLEASRWVLCTMGSGYSPETQLCNCHLVSRTACSIFLILLFLVSDMRASEPLERGNLLFSSLPASQCFAYFYLVIVIAVITADFRGSEQPAASS